MNEKLKQELETQTQNFKPSSPNTAAWKVSPRKTA